MILLNYNLYAFHILSFRLFASSLAPFSTCMVYTNIHISEWKPLNHANMKWRTCGIMVDEAVIVNVDRAPRPLSISIWLWGRALRTMKLKYMELYAPQSELLLFLAQKVCCIWKLNCCLSFTHTDLLLLFSASLARSQSISTNYGVCVSVVLLCVHFFRRYFNRSHSYDRFDTFTWTVFLETIPTNSLNLCSPAVSCRRNNIIINFS